MVPGVCVHCSHLRARVCVRVCIFKKRVRVSNRGKEKEKGRWGVGGMPLKMERGKKRHSKKSNDSLQKLIYLSINDGYIPQMDL